MKRMWFRIRLIISIIIAFILLSMLFGKKIDTSKENELIYELNKK